MPVPELTERGGICHAAALVTSGGRTTDVWLQALDMPLCPSFAQSQSYIPPLHAPSTPCPMSPIPLAQP